MVKTKAHEMAEKQKQISISEFFTKNRHLLGFDNPRKALLTTIKEAVDNALDACEEARILPDLKVIIEEIKSEKYRVTIEDNGPGIIKEQIPNIFGKLLYGSKFHKMSQTRGQQGIGISAAAMYAQLTTGKSIQITSKVGKTHPAEYFEMHLNTKINDAEIVKNTIVEWDKEHGTKIVMEMEAKYQKGRQSVDEYLKQTAISNPHVNIEYVLPTKEKQLFPRAIKELPIEPKEIKPHPYGIELGILIKMLKETQQTTIQSFLQKEFSRVSTLVAKEILSKAKIYERARPSRIARQEAENLFNAIKITKIMAPPTNCLSPIGEEGLLKGLKKEINAEFYIAATRKPAVYRGNPFQIEVALAYGGDIPGDSLAKVIRFANRVPLQYQQGACATNKAVLETSWRNYHVSQSRGALPAAPIIIIIHMASVWVPFTSESKEAIAHYDDILKEMKLAIQECGRQLGSYLRKKRKSADAEKKKSYIEKYIPHIGVGLKEILGLSEAEEKKICSTLKDTLERSRKL